MIASVAVACCYAASCRLHVSKLKITVGFRMHSTWQCCFSKRGCALERFLFFYCEDGQGSSIFLDQMCFSSSTVCVCLVGVSRQSGWSWCIWWVPLVIFEFCFVLTKHDGHFTLKLVYDRKLFLNVLN